MSALKEQILYLREQGLKYTEIVAKLGCALSTVSYYCNTSGKTNMLKRQRTHRSRLRKLTEAAKTGIPCMDCGIEYPPFVMDFDHRPGEAKLFNIGSALKDHTRQEILDEMSKCDIVCSNCHRLRTWLRLSKFAVQE